MLIVIEMNVWATVQGIAIATDQRGPSSPMEMKRGASPCRDQCITQCWCLCPVNRGDGGERERVTGGLLCWLLC